MKEFCTMYWKIDCRCPKKLTNSPKNKRVEFVPKMIHNKTQAWWYSINCIRLRTESANGKWLCWPDDWDSFTFIIPSTSRVTARHLHLYVVDRACLHLQNVARFVWQTLLYKYPSTNKSTLLNRRDRTNFASSMNPAK